VHAYFVVN